jgi:hypothetical protein
MAPFAEAGFTATDAKEPKGPLLTEKAAASLNVLLS